MWSAAVEEQIGEEFERFAGVSPLELVQETGRIIKSVSLGDLYVATGKVQACRHLGNKRCRVREWCDGFECLHEELALSAPRAES